VVREREWEEVFALANQLDRDSAVEMRNAA